MRNIVLCAGLVGLAQAADAQYAHAQVPTPVTVVGTVTTTGGGGSVTGSVSIIGTATVAGPAVTPAALAQTSVAVGGTAQTLVAANGAPRGGFILSPATGTLCADAVTTAGTLTGTPATTACSETWGGKYSIPNSTVGLSINSPTSGTKIVGNLY